MRRLFEELKAEVGSLAAVADRVGLSRSYVAKVFEGSRTSVGQKAIDEVAQNLAIRHEFFEQDDDPGSYREFEEDRSIALPVRYEEYVRDMLTADAVRWRGPYVPIDWLLGPSVLSIARALVALEAGDSGVQPANPEIERQRRELTVRLFFTNIADGPLARVAQSIAIHPGPVGEQDYRMAIALASAITRLASILEDSARVGELEKLSEFVRAALDRK